MSKNGYGYEMNDLQKAMIGKSDEAPKRFSVRVLTERPYRPTNERVEFVNKALSAEAIQKSLAAGDPIVKAGDLGLLDRGIVRSAVFERLRLGGAGEPLKKAKPKASPADPVRAAYTQYVAEQPAGSEAMRKAADELDRLVERMSK